VVAVALIVAICWAALAVQPMTSEVLKVAGVATVAACLLPGTLATLMQRRLLAVVAAAVLASSALALESAVWIGSAARSQGALLALALLVLAAAAARLGAADRQALVRTAAGLGGALGVYVLVQHAGLDPISWQGAVDRRPSATLSNATTLAGWLVLLLPVTLASAVAAVRHRWVWLALAGLQLAALLATGTRSAIAALGLVAIGAWALRDARSRRTAAMLFAAAIVAIAILAVWRPESLQDRAHLWRTAIVALAAPDPLVDLHGQPDRHDALRPWLGFGLDQQQAALQAAAASAPAARASADGWIADRGHQLLLDRALEMGALGLVAGLLLILAVARALWRAWRSGDVGRRREALAIGVALAAWLLHLQASFALTGDRTLAWIWIGMALALGSHHPATSGINGQPDQSCANPGWGVRGVQVLAFGLAGGLLLGAAGALGWLSPALSARIAPALQSERAFGAGQAAYAQAMATTGAGAARHMAAAAEAFEQAAALRRYDRDAALAAASARIELAVLSGMIEDVERARAWAAAVRRIAPNDQRVAAVEARIAAVAGPAGD
jgi:O-antigen ligase